MKNPIVDQLCDRLAIAYKEGLKTGNIHADHTEYAKIEIEYPDFADAVATAWWGN